VGKPGLIIRGINQIGGGAGNIVGAGVLCVAGQSARSQVQVIGAGFTVFTDSNGQGFGTWSYGAGVPAHYQFWYRDPQDNCSNLGFNFSNA
jgi:hypothetical protein